MPEGIECRRQQHDDYLLIYCTDGQGTLTLDEQTIPVREGDLVVLRPGQSHYYQANPRSPWTIYWTHFSGEQVEHYLAHLELKQETPILHLGLLPRLLSEFQGLMAPRLAGNNSKVFIHQALLLQELLAYCALQRNQQDAGQGIGSIWRRYTLLCSSTCARTCLWIVWPLCRPLQASFRTTL